MATFFYHGEELLLTFRPLSYLLSVTTLDTAPRQIQTTMLKLERLTLAMAEVEGWTPVIAGPTSSGSRSYRHHNPLNLRASPFAVAIVDGFAVFQSDEDGFAAARWDIRQKAKGNTVTGLNGESTLRELIHVWAPEQDGNDPASYLQNVCHMTGFIERMKLKELL